MSDIERQWQELHTLHKTANAEWEERLGSRLDESLTLLDAAASTLVSTPDGRLIAPSESIAPLGAVGVDLDLLADFARQCSDEDDELLTLTCLIWEDLRRIEDHITWHDCEECRESRDSRMGCGCYPFGDASAEPVFRLWAKWEQVLSKVDGILDGLSVFREQDDHVILSPGEYLKDRLPKHLSKLSGHFRRLGWNELYEPYTPQILEEEEEVGERESRLRGDGHPELQMTLPFRDHIKGLRRCLSTRLHKRFLSTKTATDEE